MLAYDNFAKKIAAIAQQQGFLYERAICCEQLCQKICEKNFNLLIIDENIKEILNTDLIKNFLTTSLVYPPIIIITKQNSIPIRNLCFDSGIIAYFQKDDFNEFRFIQYLQAIIIRQIHRRLYVKQHHYQESTPKGFGRHFLTNHLPAHDLKSR